MKKFKIWVILAFVLFILYLLLLNVPKKFYKTGLDCYNRKDFVCAAQNMHKALNFNHNNIDYRYYYVKSLSELGPSYYREKALYNIAKGKKEDSAKTVATNTISDWRNAILQNYPYNYIDQAVAGKHITRWSNTSFPLPIYIDGLNKAPEYFKPTIISAFNKWDSAIDFISFKYADSPNQAKIIINIENTPSNICNKKGCNYVTGTTVPNIKQRTLKQMKINIYNKTPDGKYVSDKNLYSTVLHEIGHSLGIMGHSYNADDNMYSMEKKPDIYSALKSDVHALSSGDRDTIKLLYRLEPDITDVQENKNNLIYAQMLIGTEEDRLNKKFKELEDYIRRAPDIAAGYINLGILYAENDNYAKAKQYFEKGLKYATSTNDKYSLLYNLAYVCYRTNDFKQASEYAKSAFAVKQTAEIIELIKIIASHL